MLVFNWNCGWDAADAKQYQMAILEQLLKIFSLLYFYMGWVWLMGCLGFYRIFLKLLLACSQKLLILLFSTNLIRMLFISILLYSYSKVSLTISPKCSHSAFKQLATPSRGTGHYMKPLFYYSLCHIYRKGITTRPQVSSWSTSYATFM